jgi:hypothetical protein
LRLQRTKQEAIRLHMHGGLLHPMD